MTPDRPYIMYFADRIEGELSFSKFYRINKWQCGTFYYPNLAFAKIIMTLKRITILKEETDQEPSGSCMLSMYSIAFEMHASISFVRWSGYNLMNALRLWIAAEVHSTYLNRRNWLVKRQEDI